MKELTKVEKDFASWIDAFMGRMANFLKQKNRDYGNSALDPVGVFSKHGEGIEMRLDDKLSRIKNAESIKDCEDVVYDIIGYCALICKREGWNDPFKFIK